jgi:uncharacterized protein YodC (DUF2158 family)
MTINEEDVGMVLSIGDVVYLVNGNGPSMVVSNLPYTLPSLDAKMVECVWFDSDNRLQDYEFHIDMLYQRE